MRSNSTFLYLGLQGLIVILFDVQLYNRKSERKVEVFGLTKKLQRWKSSINIDLRKWVFSSSLFFFLGCFVFGPQLMMIMQHPPFTYSLNKESQNCNFWKAAKYQNVIFLSFCHTFVLYIAPKQVLLYGHFFSFKDGWKCFHILRFCPFYLGMYVVYSIEWRFQRTCKLPIYTGFRCSFFKDRSCFLGPGKHPQSRSPESWLYSYINYRGSPDSTNFVLPGNCTIAKIVLSGVWFSTKIAIYDFWIFKVPVFSSFSL